MRVGISCMALGKGHDGISTYLNELIASLGRVARDCDFTAIVPAPARRLLGDPPHNFEYQCVRKRLSSPTASLYWHMAVLPRLARSLRFDVFHAPSYRRIPFSLHCPVVATVHDLAPWSLPSKYDPLRTFYARQIVPALLRRCAHIIAVSRATQSDLERILAVPTERISMVYSGVNHRIFRPLQEKEAEQRLDIRFQPRGPFLLNVSRIEHPGKNHCRLIEAFDLLKGRGLPHELVLVGKRWAGWEAVESRIRASPYRDKIHLLGEISTDQVVALYSLSDLVVHPSLFEGFGFPVVEAAACGTSSLCSDTSSLRELADCGSFPTFDPYDPEDMAKAIERSVEAQPDPEELHRFAKTFAWERTAQQVLGVYERVASAGSNRTNSAAG